MVKLIKEIPFLCVVRMSTPWALCRELQLMLKLAVALPHFISPGSTQKQRTSLFSQCIIGSDGKLYFCLALSLIDLIKSVKIIFITKPLIQLKATYLTKVTSTSWITTVFPVLGAVALRSHKETIQQIINLAAELSIMNLVS